MSSNMDIRWTETKFSNGLYKSITSVNLLTRESLIIHHHYYPVLPHQGRLAATVLQLNLPIIFTVHVIKAESSWSLYLVHASMMLMSLCFFSPSTFPSSIAFVTLPLDIAKINCLVLRPASCQKKTQHQRRQQQNKPVKTSHTAQENNHNIWDLSLGAHRPTDRLLD